MRADGRCTGTGRLAGCIGAPADRNALLEAQHLSCMAHTYGEVLPPSFPDVFSLAKLPSQSVFIDAGSGYGALLIAAVSEYGCQHAIGVEKYKDKYLASLDLVSKLTPELQQRISIVQQDVNDTDFLHLLSTLHFQHLLFFCNNVAFNSGTIHRYKPFAHAWLVPQTFTQTTMSCIAGLELE